MRVHRSFIVNMDKVRVIERKLCVVMGAPAHTRFRIGAQTLFLRPWNVTILRNFR